MKIVKLNIICILIFAYSLSVLSQTNDKWTLTECIDYALEQNIQVRQSILKNLSNEINKERVEAQMLPSLNASIQQNFNWAKEPDNTKSNFQGTNSTNYGINSSITIYNGQRLKKIVRQAELDIQGGIYNSEAIKESITLSILNAFLQVVASEENAKNAQSQIDATTEQLTLSEARLETGIISKSDYLQVKSQLATEKLNLANARNQLTISRVTLMQLMELPVSNDFVIERPVIDESLNKNLSPVAEKVYETALNIKPQVKAAEYQKEGIALDEEVARAGYYPSVTANAGLSSFYSSNGSDYFSQLNNHVSPTVGVSVSIPIFQQKQVNTSVSLAQIQYQDAELNEINTKNQLRKDVEQACVDVVAAQIEYEASLEKYNATQESYVVAEERFINGLINSVDFLFEKMNLIVSETELLKSQFSLIFSYKILDFYLGVPLSL